VILFSFLFFLFFSPRPITIFCLCSLISRWLKMKRALAERGDTVAGGTCGEISGHDNLWGKMKTGLEWGW
jgi:hypothetical protein